MGVNVRREVGITSPMTLEDLQEFINAAKGMGVDPRKQLALQVTKEYSDFRESWPANATLTAKQ